MLKLQKSKKGLDYYTFILAIVGILMLSFVAFGMMEKYYRLSKGLSIGSSQFRLLKTYSDAEKTLLFVDSAAKLALEKAAYAYGKSGFSASVSPCGYESSFNYWVTDVIESSSNCVPKTMSCYPDETAMKSTLLAFFDPVFAGFISNFNSESEVKIPFNYEPFTVELVVGRTEVVGTSKEAIVITRPDIKYEVKPSFRESIPVDVVANGGEIVANSQQLVKLNKGDTEKKIDEFNKAKKFEWKLVDYSKPSSSCTYDTGTTCSYDCGDDCTTSCAEWCPEPDPVTGEPVCCKEETTCVDIFCDGTIKTTVSYDEFSSLVSATENIKLLTYNSAEKKPEFKSLEHDFGLSWVETTGTSDTCS